jgi:hypothetical protein
MSAPLELMPFTERVFFPERPLARMCWRGMAFLLQAGAQYSALIASFALVGVVKSDENWGSSTCGG